MTTASFPTTIEAAHPPRDRQLRERLEALESEVAALRQRAERRAPHPEPAVDELALVAFSGELDRLLAAFTIANGAAMMGTQVRLFFTFWATSSTWRSEPRP